VANRILWSSPPDRVDDRPVQGEVIEADAPQEIRSVPDLLEDPFSDGFFPGVERKILEKIKGFLDGQSGELMMERSRRVTARATGFNLAPLQAGHG
jgi:hypothetical protein